MPPTALVAWVPGGRLVCRAVQQFRQTQEGVNDIYFASFSLRESVKKEQNKTTTKK